MEEQTPQEQATQPTQTENDRSTRRRPNLTYFQKRGIIDVLMFFKLHYLDVQLQFSKKMGCS